MKEPSKPLRQRAAHQQATEQAAQSNTAAGGGTRFETAESMIRHDASRTEVPEVIETRLKQSLREEGSGGSWWRRIFSK